MRILRVLVRRVFFHRFELILVGPAVVFGACVAFAFLGAAFAMALATLGALAVPALALGAIGAVEGCGEESPFGIVAECGVDSLREMRTRVRCAATGELRGAGWSCACL
jgi:hypothetical protein